MFYSSSELADILISKSSAMSTLTPSGGLTESYKSMCVALASAIAEAHNTFQSSAIVSGIQVSGGLCSVSGPLIGGVGVGTPGSILGSLGSTASLALSKFPTTSMSDLTPSLRSYVSGIANGFESVYNQFISSSSVLGIQVNGGTCTCQIILGAPVPGTYFGGIGILGNLSSGLTGVFSSGVLKSTILGLLDSTVLAQGSPTSALLESLTALCAGFEEYNTTWLNQTSITGIQVNGGITMPFSPIAGAIGIAGVLT